MTRWRPQSKKYGNVRTDGFDSKLEGSLYKQLLLMEKAGVIKDLKIKPNVFLTDARILTIPDFTAWDNETQEQVYFEAKGFETDVWKIKKKLWKFYGPGTLRIYKGRYTNVVFSEEIVPVYWKSKE